MYFVYDLRRDGFVVYTGLTTDPGRSLSRHLVLGRRFDSLHIVERLPRLDDARLAAQRRRYMLAPTRGAGAVGTGKGAAASRPSSGTRPTLSGYGPAGRPAALPAESAQPARR